MFTTEFEFKLYQISGLQHYVALPDFLTPIYPTQTLQHSAHATLLHHTLAWLYTPKLFYLTVSDSTMLYYTLLSPPVLYTTLCMPIDP